MMKNLTFMSGELPTYELVGIMFMLLLVIKMTKEELRMKINKIRWDLDNSYLLREDAIRE